MSSLGQLAGALSAGFVSNKIGRKHCLLLFTIPLICGWLTIIFEHENFIMVNTGRILQGFGMMPSIGQVYLTEVLDITRRETLGSSLAISIRYLIEHTGLYQLEKIFSHPHKYNAILDLNVS